MILISLHLPLRTSVPIHHRTFITRGSSWKKNQNKTCLFLARQLCMFLQVSLFTRDLNLQISFFCSLTIPQVQILSNVKL